MIRVLALIAPTLAAVLLGPAYGRENASRVFDTTYVCANTAQAGLREIEIDARRGFRDSGKWQWFASFGVVSYGAPQVTLPNGGTTTLNWSFGASSASGLAFPDPPLSAYPASVSTTPRRACAVSKKRVPLASSGLTGYSVDYFGDEYECVVPASVLVRLRAVFTQPATFRRDRFNGALGGRRASGDVREAQLAIRTIAGKPLAFATASASGVAKLFTAPGCAAR